MAKFRKPIWIRILIWVISTLLSIVAILGAFCGFLYIKYEINVFEVASQIKILNEEIDLSKIVPNAYTDEDMAGAKIVTDAGINGLISFTEQDGYSITPDDVEGNLISELKFTDRQIGAIIDNLITSQEDIIVKLGDKDINLNDYGFQVVQVAFSNITETTTDFNVVIKIDLDKVKEDMTEFPLNWIKKGIPNSLYFSATTTITKGTNAFEYTTEGKGLVINNLTKEETDSIFKTINKFIQLGNSNEFSKIIGDIFINVLIGNESNAGLAYSLKDVGATDFSFETDGANNYFVIEM